MKGQLAIRGFHLLWLNYSKLSCSFFHHNLETWKNNVLYHIIKLRNILQQKWKFWPTVALDQRFRGPTESVRFILSANDFLLVIYKREEKWWKSWRCRFWCLASYCFCCSCGEIFKCQVSGSEFSWRFDHKQSCRQFFFCFCFLRAVAW